MSLEPGLLLDYLDFILRIDARPGAGETLVVASPAGHGAKAPFTSPLGEGELRRLAATCLRAAEEAPLPRSRHVRALGSALAADPLLRDVGDRLFRALLAGPVKECFVQSLERAAARRHGLRLRLRFDLDDAGGTPSAVAPHRLPWELLYRRETGELLALGCRTLVVRDLSVVAPPEPPASRARRGRPLVVLAMAAEPRGCPALDLEGELRSLERAFASRSAGVEVRRLAHATLDRLVAALQEGDADALHFMGHGDLDVETGEGLLYLEDAAGGAAPVSGDQLVHQVRDTLPGLRLVFLNACRTGEASAAAPWTGVATALVRAGCGAVVAMQHRVCDSAATVFSREVYRRLAAGGAVDVAVAEGRLALARCHPGSVEWATPALFLRASPARLAAGGGEGDEGPVEENRPVARWKGTAVAGALVVAVAVGALAGLLRSEPSVPPPQAGSAEAAAETVEEGGRVAVASMFGEAKPLEAGEPGDPGDRADPPSVREAPEVPGVTPARVHELVFGEPLHLEEARATVTADLVTTYGRELVRFTVAPDEGSLQVRPAAGPGPLVFRWGDDHLFLDVLAVDRRAGTVRLRATR